MTKALYTYSLTELLDLINNQQVTSLEVINSFYDRIGDREHLVKAWQSIKPREAYINEYLSNKNFYDTSLLKGLPIGIKDVIDTIELTTEMGSPIHKDREALADANCVLQFKKAGAIVMGKTVTTEFAYFSPGKTANPNDFNRTPGGSSSGSAAAVADNMVPMALGTQTAASVIRPAAYCGTVGYVSSINEFSLRGIQPLAQSFDALGFFANRIDDIALLRNVALCRESTGDTIPQRPLKIIVCDGKKLGDIDSEMELNFQKFIDVLKHHVSIVPFEFSDELQNLIHAHHMVMAFEVSRNLVFEYMHQDLLSEKIKELIYYGQLTSYEEYVISVKYIQHMREYYHSMLASLGADIVVAPAASGVAPLGLHATGLPFMSRPWQALGLPTISLPLYSDNNHLPLGMQLIGKSRQDDDLLAIANWINNFF